MTLKNGCRNAKPMKNMDKARLIFVVYGIFYPSRQQICGMPCSAISFSCPVSVQPEIRVPSTSLMAIFLEPDSHRRQTA
jgi:hypothetical protein